jgi:hypothetical protein
MACKLLVGSEESEANSFSYVWGDDVAKAKTQCESLDYLFQLAVEMHRLGVPWV